MSRNQFNMMKEARKFAELSHQYSDTNIQSDKDKYQKEVKDLIANTAKMVSTYFNTIFIQKKKGFVAGKNGILMTAPNMYKVIDAMTNDTILNPSKMVRYNNTEQPKNGAVFLMDYSGSMWFDGLETFDDVKRIHMQNFIVLTITHMLQRMNKTKIILIPYSTSPAPFESHDILNEDLDLFLVNDGWASMKDDYRESLDGVPKKLKELCNHDRYEYRRWAGDEYPEKAINMSLDMIKKDNIKKYAYMIFTDGGMSRVGETDRDRKKFIDDLLISITKNVDESLFEFVFIKTQLADIQETLTEMNKHYSVFDDVESVNGAFEVISNSIIKLFNDVKG